jgi:hypothetical protein
MSQVDVTITNGVPNPSSVNLQDTDFLVFTNKDSSAHLIELWTKSQACIEIGIYLAPSPGTITLVPDPNDENATIYYNVLTPGQRTDPNSGAHGIIVGSGAAMGEAA